MTFDLNAAAYDVSINGIPFLYHNSPNEPNIRQTADFKRQQFDAAPDAGEQTLSRWWLRSQASFHGGAGQTYLEPAGGQDEVSRIRFNTCKGVDVWTPGQVTRLNATSLNAVGAVTALVTATDGTTDYAFMAVGTGLKVYNSTTSLTTVYTWGGAGTIKALATDGSHYYAADATGIYRGPIDGSVAGTLLWTIAATNVALGWTKQRLMAGLNNKVYELSGAGPGLPATANYTHPDTSWRWSGFAEGPTAIMAAGSSGGQSAVVKFDLDVQGVALVLTSAGVAINMPAGEKILCIQDYLGSFIALGTNTGLWVAAIDSFSGNATLGPKTLDFGVPVKGVVGRGRFLYVAASQQISGGESGLYRVDLGTTVDKTGHYAYAPDLTTSGATTDVGMVALLPTTQKLIFAVGTSGGSAGVWRETSSKGTASAWLKTSRIRYSTVEPKVFKRARVRGDFGSSGTLVIYAETPHGGEVTETTLTNAGKDPAEIVLNVTADEWLALRFEMSSYSTAELRSYQLKAAPGGPRDRTLQLVLGCFDSEGDRNGVSVGYQGWGWERLAALEAAENNADQVAVKFYARTGTITEQAIVEKVQFIETARTRGETPSGYVVVTVTTVA